MMSVSSLLQLIVVVISSYLSSSNSQEKFASVTDVSVSGNEGSYNFSVTLSSPDNGCKQYADWWEVVSEDGELLYRRILFHSHVNEQPFTRSGGKVDIKEDQLVWIRAHMNNTGYGGAAMMGSAKGGFTVTKWPENLGTNLDQVQPLPKGCNF
ncbi:MAG: hypothetical protein AAF391_12500 [Bacteroidota bacterium]